MPQTAEAAYILDGSVEVVDLEEFIAMNDLDHATAADLRALVPGETFVEASGGAAGWKVERVR